MRVISRYRSFFGATPPGWRIINTTRWTTRALKSVFAQCLARIRATEPHTLPAPLTIFIGWNERASITGRAFPQSATIVLLMPRPREWDLNTPWPFHAGPRGRFKNAQAVADVFLHEVGHCCGIAHNTRRTTIEHRHHGWIGKTFSAAPFPLRPCAAVYGRPVKPPKGQPDSNALPIKTCKNLLT